jgi:hypothetical protein
VLLLEKALEISRTETLGRAKQAACALHGLDAACVVICHRGSPNIDWVESNEQKTLHELDFIDGHSLLLRMNGLLDLQFGGSSPSAGKSANDSIGLQNLGNTCYMNASVQCLLHTPLLTEYFESDYLCDLNTTGTWGMAGKLAVAFAELVADVGKARRQGVRTVAPRTLKRVIGDFQPQFAGWKQQDAQEFLSVFMAGLSEDVNRTRAKPYIELKDSDGRPDVEVALEFWTAHCRRERSALSALFSGQFKSVLRCRTCGHSNSAFDPFSFLPIPLPENDFRWVTCNVVGDSPGGSQNKHTVQVCARVPKQGNIADLLSAVDGLLGFRSSELVAADVTDGFVFKLYEADHSLSSLGDDARPAIYHAPPPLLGFQPAKRPDGDTPTTTSTDGSSTDDCIIFLVHRRIRKVQRYFLNPYRSEVFGNPVVVRVAYECPASDIYRAAWRQVSHLIPDFHMGDTWPLTLKKVKRDGASCDSCTWRQGCWGCVVKADQSQPLSVAAQSTFSIDWDATAEWTHTQFAPRRRNC